MSIHIELSRADVDCLVDHLPLGSDLRDKLGNSGTIPSSVGLPIGDSNPIDCSEGEARELLRIASDHCSEVVQKIQVGMRLSGVIFS